MSYQDDATSLLAGLVDAFYRVLLGREADAEGLSNHAKRLTHGDISVEGLLREFVASEEAASARRQRILAAALSDVGSRQPWAANCEIVSLGTHCYTSAILKAAGLKKNSGPFDWLFSNANMIAECFEEDFSDFLNQEHYRPVPISDRAYPHANLCDHQLYLDRYNIKYVFNHRDPTRASDYAYFVRCVERLRALRQANDGPVLLCTVRTAGDVHGEFERLRVASAKYFANSVLVMIAVCDATGSLPTAETLIQDDRSSLHRLDASSEWGGLNFASLVDDLFLFTLFCEQASFLRNNNAVAG